MVVNLIQNASFFSIVSQTLAYRIQNFLFFDQITVRLIKHLRSLKCLASWVRNGCDSSFGGGCNLQIKYACQDFPLQIRRTSDKLFFRGNILAARGVVLHAKGGCISTTNTTT